LDQSGGGKGPFKTGERIEHNKKGREKRDLLLMTGIKGKWIVRVKYGIDGRGEMEKKKKEGAYFREGYLEEDTKGEREVKDNDRASYV